MTREEYKREAIQYQWALLVGSENFDNLKLDENGWSNWKCKSLMPNELFTSLDWKLKSFNTREPSGSDMLYRPKSLKGLELNNGWHKIISIDDMPSKEGLYTFLVDNREVNQYYELGIRFDIRFTHWRNIIEIPKPLY